MLFQCVISVTDVTSKIYSVLASNVLAFTLRVCYSYTCHPIDAKFNWILLKCNVYLFHTVSKRPCFTLIIIDNNTVDQRPYYAGVSDVFTIQCI